MFDHPPRRQIGQFVIIGRPEQLILDGLLLADVGGARKQQIAVRDTNRAMAGEKDLLDRAAGEAFFRNGGAPGAEQFDTGFAAVVQFPGSDLAGGDPKLGRRGIVHQQEAALLVLNRDAGGEHSEHIPQNAEFALADEFVLVCRCGGLQVMLGAALHGRRTCQGLL